jgi:hypothetical protein
MGFSFFREGEPWFEQFILFEQGIEIGIFHWMMEEDGENLFLPSVQHDEV